MENKSKILIIDDEKGMRDVLSKCLDSYGYIVAAAEDAEDGIKKISQEDFNVVLCDIKMPKMQGVEALEIIKKIRPKTEVIMITSYADINIAVECIKKGAYDFHEKPFNIHKLMFSVERALEKIYIKSAVDEGVLKLHRLESLRALAGYIVHDFNNILTVIIGNISIAKIELKPKDNVFGLLTEMEKASQRAASLIQQLTVFSRGGILLKKLTSVAKLIKDSAEFVLKDSSVKCKFIIPDDLWSIEADEGQISQVINNLMANAIQATPNAGIIEVSAGNLTMNEKQNLPLKESQYIRISIKDSGVGIPQDYLEKIFDPYFTTKQNGNGLGLAVVQFIIKNHNGYIFVSSKLGNGTTFDVYLPASNEKIAAETYNYNKEISIKGNGKILLMDDEEYVRNVGGRMLKHFGYEAEFAKDGSEAIAMYKKAKEAGEPFIAVIIDLIIPGGMGGKETIKKLLEIDPKVKAIVSSGYSNDSIMSEYEKYGFCGVVAKPYRIEELSETLQKIINQS